MEEYDELFLNDEGVLRALLAGVPVNAWSNRGAFTVLPNGWTKCDFADVGIYKTDKMKNWRLAADKTEFPVSLFGGRLFTVVSKQNWDECDNVWLDALRSQKNILTDAECMRALLDGMILLDLRKTGRNGAWWLKSGVVVGVLDPDCRLLSLPGPSMSGYGCDFGVSEYYTLHNESGQLRRILAAYIAGAFPMDEVFDTYNDDDWVDTEDCEKFEDDDECDYDCSHCKHNDDCWDNDDSDDDDSDSDGAECCGDCPLDCDSCPKHKKEVDSSGKHKEPDEEPADEVPNCSVCKETDCPLNPDNFSKVLDGFKEEHGKLLWELFKLTDPSKEEFTHYDELLEKTLRGAMFDAVTDPEVKCKVCRKKPTQEKPKQKEDNTGKTISVVIRKFPIEPSPLMRVLTRGWF